MKPMTASPSFPESRGIQIASERDARPAAISAAPEAPVAARKVPRNPALDFTKGALVVIMVLYHWLNYFVAVGGFGYRYLRFLTPSFIFITGFFVSHVYLAKYDIADRRLPRRLLERGLKLVAIFFALNLAIALLVRGGMASLIGDWAAYLTGKAGDSRAAFSVLLPIGYLLILSAGLVVLSRLFGKALQVGSIVLLVAALILSMIGQSNAYLELVAIGMLGICVGYLPIERTNGVVRHPFWLGLAYAGYLAAITVWNEQFFLQVAGVCLSVAIIYALGMQSDEPGRVRKAILLLGQYSLLGYIAQIVVLQVLRRGLRLVDPIQVRAALGLVLGMALTLLAVGLVDRGRRSFRIVNKVYSAVFA